MCNRLMEDLFTDPDLGVNFYNSFFLFNIVEDNNSEFTQRFYSEKLNMIDNIIFTENLETMQLNLSKFSDSNLSMSMSRSYSNDKLNTDREYLDDNSVNLNLNNLTKTKSKSRSKTKVQYLGPPKVNIKVKLKDIIKEDVIENSILDKQYNLKKKNLNITNISKVNDTSAIMNEEPSFVDIIDILAQTDLSYKAAIKQKKLEKMKNVTNRARSPVYTVDHPSKSTTVNLNTGTRWK